MHTSNGFFTRIQYNTTLYGGHYGRVMWRSGLSQRLFNPEDRSIGVKNITVVLLVLLCSPVLSLVLAPLYNYVTTLLDLSGGRAVSERSCVRVFLTGREVNGVNNKSVHLYIILYLCTHFCN